MLLESPLMLVQIRLRQAEALIREIDRAIVACATEAQQPVDLEQLRMARAELAAAIEHANGGPCENDGDQQICRSLRQAVEDTGKLLVENCDVTLASFEYSSDSPAA